MRKILLTLGLSLSFIQIVSADVYMEMRMFGDVPMKTWTTSDKQRSEAETVKSQNGMGGLIDGMSAMIGGMGSSIIRVDKGVMWNVQHPKKQYLEINLVEEYHGAAKFPAQVDSSNLEEGDGKEETPGKIEIVKLPEKQIAGYSATGYKVVVDGKPEMILWRAPLTGDLAQAYKETNQFNQNMLAKKYSNYPAKEREDLSDAATLIGGAFMGDFASLLKGVMTIPEGYTLGMEYFDEGKNTPTVAYMVNKIVLAPIPASTFEPPAGYKKAEMPKLPDMSKMKFNEQTGEVEGVSKEQMNQVMKQMQEMMGGQGTSQDSEEQLSE
jgi:hypothetical protein